MSETNDLLTQIVTQLQKLNTSVGIVNQGISMLLEKSDAELLDKLDEIGGLVGDIKEGLLPSTSLEQHLTAIRESLDTLPVELDSAMQSPARQRAK